MYRTDLPNDALRNHHHHQHQHHHHHHHQSDAARHENQRPPPPPQQQQVQPKQEHKQQQQQQLPYPVEGPVNPQLSKADIANSSSAVSSIAPTPPYPTIPYPGFIDYHSTNISTGSLSQINQRDEIYTLGAMKKSNTYSSIGSFESIPNAPRSSSNPNQPSLPPKIPLDQADYHRNNSMQSSYSLDSGSTIESFHTSSSKTAKEPETIRSFEDVPQIPPPPYEDSNYGNSSHAHGATGLSNAKSEKLLPQMTKQLDRLSDELQQFQIDTGSPSRVQDPNLVQQSRVEQPIRRKPPPPTEVPVQQEQQHQGQQAQQPPHQQPSSQRGAPQQIPQQPQPAQQVQPTSPVYSDEISIENFNRIKDYAIEDFRKGQFSAEAQIDWIKTMFQYASNQSFLQQYNINGEKLTRLLSSNEVKKNEQIFVKQAIKLLKKVVHVTKDPDAQYIIACLYSNSPNIKVPFSNVMDKDYSKAFDYYAKSATQGHPLAMYRLGVSYEIGIGTSKNEKKAMDCFIRSAEFGSVASMFKLGMIYSRGILNVERSASKSLKWLNRAAELASPENPHSLFELAKYYEYDFPFLKSETLTQSDAQFLRELQSMGLIKDERVALQYYKEAAKLSYPPAQCKLGWCYEYGKLGNMIDAKRSIGWYSRAAKQGNFTAEMALSGWYLTGAKGILEANDKEAFLWARKAAESGFDKAEYALGYYYEVGLGCTADFELSKKFYLKAATQGHEKAITKLKEMRGR